MNTEKRNIEISKFLSLVLRHQPEIIHIQLDENGWTDVATLIKNSYTHGVKFDFEVLKHIVETNPKKRFAFNEAGDMIRASQGHSVQIDLGYESKIPPDVLFHGTAVKNVDSVLASGIEKRSRTHVHLSKDIETAINVGQRHGKPFVFKIAAGQMHLDNFKFFLSENGVWLTDHIPAKYLSPYES